MKMTIGRAVCVCVVVFHFSVNVAAELTMPSCINGWTTVEDDKDTVITCSDQSLNQSVLWRVENSTRNQTIFEGSCNISQKNCTFSSNDQLSLTLDNTLQSSLVIKKANVRTHGGAVVSCSDSKIHRKCSINVIHVPTLTQCKIEVNPGNRTVTGSCNIDKFFSSNNLSSCAVTPPMGKTEIYGKPVEGQISLQDYTDSEDNKPYKQGNCTFTTHLPTAIGNYTYSIAVPPIQVGKTVGKIEIETTCTLVDKNCSWECLKQPGSIPNYVCNPSDRLRTSNVTSTTPSGPTSSSPAPLGSSSSAHYSSSQPVSLSSFTSVAVVSTTTHVSSSVLTHVTSPSSTHKTSPPSTDETSPPSPHETSSPSTHETSPPSTHETSPPSTRVSTSPTTHMSSPTSTHISSFSSTRLSSSPLVPLGSPTSNPSENRHPAVGSIVAGILVALVVIIIVIVIIYIVKRKRNQSWTLPKFLGSLRGDKVTRRNNSYQLQVENPDGQKESSGENRQSNEFEDQVNTMYVSADIFAVDEQGSHQVLPVT
ncbi:flocculation protein FLO11-like [Pomacea canaliculata]|uniref:flocculation protein FLO11-like n=1 Tax=Pomacea canaliculata TaxID=400727 RepID=UPI000D732185|nr:flocculation protein FLO11-like [Pomacea canaliculata]